MENTLPQSSEHYTIMSKINSCLNTILTPPLYSYLYIGSANNGMLTTNNVGSSVVLSNFPPEGQTLETFGLTPANITHLAIPNTLQTWPTSSLRNCTGLQALTAYGPKAETASIEITSGHSFASLNNLRFVHLPTTVQCIGSGRSSSDGSGNIFPRTIQSIHFQDSVFLHTIEKYAFLSCSSITSLDFSRCSSLQLIGTWAFSNCPNVLSINFSGCTSLRDILAYAFRYCTRLTFLNFSGCSSLYQISEEAFNGCGLTRLDLSECSSLQDLGRWAFTDSKNLQTVILPASLVRIRACAFSYCTSLQTVYWMGAQKPADLATDAFYACPGTLQHVMNYKPS